MLEHTVVSLVVLSPVVSCAPTQLCTHTPAWCGPHSRSSRPWRPTFHRIKRQHVRMGGQMISYESSVRSYLVHDHCVYLFFTIRVRSGGGHVPRMASLMAAAAVRVCACLGVYLSVCSVLLLLAVVADVRVEPNCYVCCHAKPMPNQCVQPCNQCVQPCRNRRE